VLLSMSRRVSPLAGFQVTIIGRFWVTTEANPSRPGPDRLLTLSPYFKAESRGSLPWFRAKHHTDESRRLFLQGCAGRTWRLKCSCITS
jgi:hypothetical protein